MIIKYTTFTILIISVWTTCSAQELVTFRDTVNHFEIGIPTGWTYRVPPDKSLELIAWRQKQNDQDVFIENFNVNIVHHHDADLNKTYGEFLKTIEKVEEFKILEQGEKIINDRKYKYLIETHKNPLNNTDITNYDLFANHDGEILILTMVTNPEHFEKFKNLFDTIASSLKF